jgi:tetratricopeptide (TPR) repeat protein
LKDYTIHPLLNRNKPEQGDKRRFNWKLLLVIPALFAAGFFEPQISKLIADFDRIDPLKLFSNMFERELPAETQRVASFEAVLTHALRSESKVDRQKANLGFQALLRRVASNPSHDARSAVLFARAADFYSSGSELSASDVERLYLLALEAIEQVHGEDYHDLENVYAGLEKFYLSQGRYDEAVTQARSLLDFYRRYRKDPGAQLELVGPVTVRLGHNLMKAGRNLEARDAYRVAAGLWRSAGQQTSEIESFIEATYLTGEARPDASGNFRSAVEAVQMDGVVVEEIVEDEDRITIVGFAVDNKRIADYLRLLKNQVSRPDLNLVASGRRQHRTVSEFSISIKKR